jgi:hypothetical protein
VKVWRTALCGMVLVALVSPGFSLPAVAPAKGNAPGEPSSYELWWRSSADGSPTERPTFIYGEMQVLASGPMTYYCGCEWLGGGEPTSGYSGLQEHNGRQHNVIFTVWDTSRTLPAYLAQADPTTALTKSRPGDPEGDSCHTDAPCAWKEGAVFRFALTRRPQKLSRNTLTSFYFFDESRKTWVLEASLSSPPAPDGKERVFSGGKDSFLEQFAGDDAGPKVCIYRLWAGTAPGDLVYFRKARAIGRWGIVNGCYCLARGDEKAVAAVVARASRSPHDLPIASKAEDKVGPVIPDWPLAKGIIDELKSLPVPKASAD